MKRLFRASSLCLLIGASTVAQAQHTKVSNDGQCLPSFGESMTWDNALNGIQPPPPLGTTPFDLSYDQSQSQLFAASSSPQTFAPNMIGDMTAGACGALLIDGAVGASLGHPTYGCSRLNISEQNSPVVRDRAYFSYRHFHNASNISVFPYSPYGGQNAVDINKYTLGVEKTLFGDGFSIEARLPIVSQLSSDLYFSHEGGSNGPDVYLPLNATDTQIGNISFILKKALLQNERWYVSAGLGINIPTAKDVSLSGLIDDPNYEVYDLDGTRYDDTVNVNDLRFRGVYKNETVNLSPFIAGLWTPTNRFFVQGFLQVDVPLNSSEATLTLNGEVEDVQVPPIDASDKIAQQTLMRINVGTGYWFYLADRNSNRWLRGIAGMFEVHHTTTLNDADIVGPVTVVENYPLVPDMLC